MRNKIMMAVAALMLGAAGIVFATQSSSTMAADASCCCKDCASCCVNGCVDGCKDCSKCCTGGKCAPDNCTMPATASCCK